MAVNPQTLTTITDILKNKYLSPVQEAFNNATILLNRLPREGAVIVGNRYEFPLHCRRNFGTGPRAADTGSTVGYLPEPGHQVYSRGYLQRTNYYARFKITGSAISASKGDGAMVDVLDGEMRGCKDDLSKHVNRDLYGHSSGDGRLCTVTGTANSTTVTVDTTKYLEVGMPVVCAVAATGVVLGANDDQTIVSIPTATTFTVAAAMNVTATTHAIYTGGTYTSGSEYAAAWGKTCAGLALIELATGTYAGIDRAGAGNEYFQATRVDGSAGLTLRKMMETQQAMRTKANGKLSLLLTSYKQWNNYGDLILPDRRWVGTVKKLDGGFDSLDFNGVPIVPDADCPDSEMHFLDESTFSIVEEEKLNFIDYGGILCRVGSGATAEDAVEGTLVWRFNLMCKNPAKNAVIVDLP